MKKYSIITRDPRFLRSLGEADRVAPTPVPVLLEGASGTGKELMARRIHHRGAGGGGPFIPVNCGALCESLAESELFGHAAGAFTGAIRERKGLFEEASGGTIFLDEIGELPLPIQAKLLRVLQEGEIRRLGEIRQRAVRFRLIAATNRNLRTERDEGRFREDLFYRIHVVRIELPPLRDRPGDITPLAKWLLARVAHHYGRVIHGISDDALRLLERYTWPGNVRELENELRRATALAGDSRWLEAHHFSETVRYHGGLTATAPLTLQEKLIDMEKSEIVKTMDRTEGNKTQAANALGLSRQGLKNKLVRYGL